MSEQYRKLTREELSQLAGDLAQLLARQLPVLVRHTVAPFVTPSPAGPEGSCTRPAVPPVGAGTAAA